MPLPMDWMKMNIDAVDANKGVVGCGAIMRNRYGLVMVAGINQGVFSNDVMWQRL